MKKIFEKIGKLFFQKNRMPFFLMALSLGPLLSAFFLFIERQSVADLEATSFQAMSRAKIAFSRKSRKDIFLAKHQDSDPYFLDKEIESLSFLNSEKNLLKNWLSHPAVSSKDKIICRLHLLESGENHLSFAEEEIQVSKTCKETVEKQRFPIECDADDLEKLLYDIEEISTNDREKVSKVTSAKGRPQLLISNFSLMKKNTPLQNEVFEITMDLLKREFLTK